MIKLFKKIMSNNGHLPSEDLLFCKGNLQVLCLNCIYYEYIHCLYLTMEILYHYLVATLND